MTMDLTGNLLIDGILIIIIASLFYWFFSTAPFIQAPFREWGKWATIAVAAIVLLVQVVIPFLRSVF